MKNTVDIKKNYENVQLKIKKSCQENQRSAIEITFLAISKGQSLEKIEEVYKLGHRNFAENYQQELSEKASLCLKKGLKIKWSFTGTLQSNKIKKIMLHADEIQSVACYKHAEKINDCQSVMKQIPFPIYLAVNVENEETKSGMNLNGLSETFDKIQKNLKNLSVQGVMAIPPKGALKSRSESIMDLCKIAKTTGLGKLSLGMSDDYEEAIGLGATTVRIGRALFGERVK
ncbi:MAG: YggS family pyridoxal phosphate-dependent enzyme [Zetaproteobacteria bacterium]|nr:YggS family pyridoxal phosphate-dependent enzyme [Pseudobdellovibrionaceae bacterium]